MLKDTDENLNWLVPGPHWSRQVTDNMQDIVGRLADVIILPGEPMEEERLDGGRFRFLAGEHGGLSIKENNAMIVCDPGAVFTRKAVIEASCTIKGAHFKGTGGSNNEDLLVDVTSADATVAFMGCIFEKSPEQVTAFVNIADDARASFIGCVFIPVMPTAGTVVNNLGGGGKAANVGIIGCSNRTTKNHANVTSIFETT